MMEKAIPTPESGYVERRKASGDAPGVERRQFSASYDNLSPEAQEIGEAIDRYKLLNRRRYIDYEELLGVLKTLGYSK